MKRCISTCLVLKELVAWQELRYYSLIAHYEKPGQPLMSMWLLQTYHMNAEDTANILKAEANDDLSDIITNLVCFNYSIAQLDVTNAVISIEQQKSFESPIGLPATTRERIPSADISVMYDNMKNLKLDVPTTYSAPSQPYQYVTSARYERVTESPLNESLTSSVNGNMTGNPAMKESDSMFNSQAHNSGTVVSALQSLQVRNMIVGYHFQ